MSESAPSDLPSPDSVDEIIACHQRAKEDADERGRQQRAEEKRRGALLGHLLDAWGRTRSDGGPLTDATNWVGLLHALLTTTAPYAGGEIVGRLPERGEARRVVARVCGLVQVGDPEQAVTVLGRAFDSALAAALWEDLSRHLPEDVACLLPEDLQAKFREQQDGPARATAAAAAAIPVVVSPLASSGGWRPAAPAKPNASQEPPRKLLKGWKAIATAVEMKHAQRNEIKGLNEKFNGPIRNTGRGTWPMVYLDDLRAWWDSLDSQAQEMKNRREGTRLSAEARHNYGRDGTAAPEVGGGVKKRRRDRRT
jgi:hypothetical protein